MTTNDEKSGNDDLPIALAFKALGGGLWEYNIDTDTLVCSSKWYQIVGIDESTTRINSIDEFKPYIHPDDVQHATAIDLEEIGFLIGRDERYYNEFRIVRPTGEIRHLRSVACLIEDGFTGQRRAVGCITDLADLTMVENGAAPWPLHTRSGPAPPHSEPDQGEAVETLSIKERECLMWVSVGKTALETGAIMGTSRRTVEFHIGNAIRKLGAVNKIHATVIALRKGIL